MTLAKVDGIEVPIYRWDPWPENLYTKAQLSEKGFNPGAVAGVIFRSKSPDGYLRLYRLEDAIPKRQVSEETKKKLKAARDKATTCSDCGRRLHTRWEIKFRYCSSCSARDAREADRLDAGRQAHEIICRGDFVVWDSETTDLNGKFIEVAAVNEHGKVLFDSRIRPHALCAQGAYDVHGIKDEELASAPSFYDIYSDLRAVLHQKHWIIYNANFDMGVLQSETHDYENVSYYSHYPIVAAEVDCAMLLFAQFYGEWHTYYKNYRYQKLSTAASSMGIHVDLPAHSALGDCLTTLEVLYALADYYRKEML